MNLEPGEEQVALRDTVRRYLAQNADVTGHVRTVLADPSDRNGSAARVWHGLAELGATGVLVPVEFGGSGMTMVDACIVAEELGAALHPGPWLSTAVAAPRAVARFGVDTAASELLTRLGAGSLMATVAPANALRATPGSAGATLRGTAAAVEDAAAAHVILAVVDDGADVELYSVETASPAVTVAVHAGIDPTRRACRVTFDDAPATLLGSADRAAVTALVDDVLIASAADALGAASRLVGVVIEYAKNRVQFGQPIGSFQSVAHLCVDMYETVELTRSGVMHAAWAADYGDADTRHLAALRLKGFAARLAAVGDTAIQVLGGIGFTWDHDAHLYLKRLLSWSALEGSSSPYLEEIGRRFVRSVVDGATVP